MSSGLIAGGALTGILIATLKGWIWEVSADGIEISIADKLNTGLGESMGISGDFISLSLFLGMAAILLFVAISKKDQN